MSENQTQFSYEEAKNQLSRPLQKKIQKRLDHYCQTTSGKLIQAIFNNQVEADLASNKVAIAVAVSLLELLYYQYQKEQSYYPDHSCVPMGLRCSKLTQTSYADYHKNSSLKQWMGAVNREATDELEKAGLISQERERWDNQNSGQGTARLYNARPLNHQFIQLIREKAQQQEQSLKDYQSTNPYCNSNPANKPAPKGKWNKHSKKLPEATKKTFDKLRNSTFCFDQAFYEEFGEWIINRYSALNSNGNKIDSHYACMMSIYYNLNAINTNTPLPQYHGTWELQQAGRLHTIGGSIGLPKPIRWTFIRPANPNNVLLEIDLKSAQLILLCKQLGCHELLNQIREIMEQGESVWDYIKPKGYQGPKRALKTLTYGLCFGANLKNLHSLCNKELSKKGDNFRFKKQDIKQVTSGFLKPLVSAREKWLSKYQIERIQVLKQQNKSTTISNQLGLRFHLAQEMKSYLRECNQKNIKPNSNEIAKKALAHIAQGAEQYVMHNFIASTVVENNINTFQYDGITLEVRRDLVATKKHEADNWLTKFDSNLKFDYEVIDHQNDPEFNHYQNYQNETDIIKELSKR